MTKRRGNGEGSITHRKDGRWMGRYTVRTTNGPKQKALYGPDAGGSGGEPHEGNEKGQNCSAPRPSSFEGLLV
jgi:hypothetical protein